MISSIRRAISYILQGAATRGPTVLNYPGPPKKRGHMGCAFSTERALFGLATREPGCKLLVFINPEKLTRVAFVASRPTACADYLSGCQSLTAPFWVQQDKFLLLSMELRLQ